MPQLLFIKEKKIGAKIEKSRKDDDNEIYFPVWHSQISCIFSQQIAIIILAIQCWTGPSFIAFLFKTLVIIKYFKLGKELQLLHSRKFKIDNFLTITQMHEMASLRPYLTSHSCNYLNIGKTILSFPAKYLLNSVGEISARLSVTG